MQIWSQLAGGLESTESEPQPSLLGRWACERASRRERWGRVLYLKGVIKGGLLDLCVRQLVDGRMYNRIGDIFNNSEGRMRSEDV